MIDLFQKRNRVQYFNLLLAVQLCFDSFLLVTYLIKSVLTYFVAIPIQYFSFYPLFVCPALRFCLICTVFLTVTLTYSRAMAVEHPIRHRSSQLSQEHNMKRLMSHLFPVCLVSSILTIPWFFEYIIEEGPTTASGSPVLLASDIRLNPMYSFTYTVTFSLLFLCIFPTIALIILSGKIYKGMNNSHVRALSRRANSQIRMFNVKTPKSKLVIAIVIFFLIFSIPRVLFTIIELILQSFVISKNNALHKISCPFYYCLGLLNNLNKLFTVINSSIHVFLHKGVSVFYK